MSDLLLRPASAQSSTRRKNKINYSTSFKVSSKSNPFSRSNELRHSTGSMKGKNMVINPSATNCQRADSVKEDENDGGSKSPPPNVHNLIKEFDKEKSVNGDGSKSPPSYASYPEFNSKPGYVVEDANPIERSKSKRKLSIKQKKSKMTADDARHSIIQSLGISPFASNENRGFEKSFAYFDVQSMFFDLSSAAIFNGFHEEGVSFSKKLTGAAAANAANSKQNKNGQYGEFDPVRKRWKSRVESMVDEGDDTHNHLVLSCPYFRNEVAETIDKSSQDSFKNSAKDVSKLISMFNHRNRSFEKLNSNSFGEADKRHSQKHNLTFSESDIILESVDKNSSFFTWDQPNVAGPQLFHFEHVDRGAMYYQEFFNEAEHTNLFGLDKSYGPIAISIVREALPKMAVLDHDRHKKDKNKYQYRIILRTNELQALRISILENSIPSTSRHNSNRPIPIKDVLEHCFPDVDIAALRHATPGIPINETLLKIDEQQLSLKHKVGLLYCKAGQKTEEEMYNNEHAGAAFREFCSVIADKVALKGFQGYRAGLDVNSDSTGQHSHYTVFHGREIMFHVSTELPFTQNNKQQLLRKRHIGNDIVTVIFQEPGSEPFTPQIILSHFQHVFIIVRVVDPTSEDPKYEVAMTRSMDVPPFGPPIPPDMFSKGPAFREFLLSKLINAENAAHKSDKFTHMLRRTRLENLKDLAKNKTSAQTVEPPNKFGFSFTKKKEKTHPPVCPEIWLQGGFIWSVKFEDGSASTPCYLSISTKSTVFVELMHQSILLSIPCKSVLGWKKTTNALKIYYDNGDMAHFTLSEGDKTELPYVINRLKTVTRGCETQSLSLRRNNDGQLGFHVYYQGMVADVEAYALAWQAGLRKNSRLLEISGQLVSKMAHEKMIQMLKRPGAVRIVVLPPTTEGHARNGHRVKNLRRFSSMTSVYSIAPDTLDNASSSSHEYLTATSTDSPMTPRKVKTRAMSVEAALPQTDMSLDLTKAERQMTKPRKQHDSIVASQSATEIATRFNEPIHITTPLQQKVHVQIKPPATKSSNQSHTAKSSNQFLPQLPNRVTSPVKSPTKTPVKTVKSPPKFTSPLSPDQELVDLELQLADTRKSIDAKLYHKLENSKNPFFHPPSGLPEDEEVFVEGRVQSAAQLYTRRLSDFTSTPKVRAKSDAHSFPVVTQADRCSSAQSLHKPRTTQRNTSLEYAFENPRRLPSSPREEDSGFAVVDIPSKIETPFKVSQVVMKTSEPVVIGSDERKRSSSIDSPFFEEGSTDTCTETQSKDVSDTDSTTRLVKTQVREVSDIISERKNENLSWRTNSETSDSYFSCSTIDSRKSESHVSENFSTLDSRKSEPRKPFFYKVEEEKSKTPVVKIHSHDEKPANDCEKLNESISETFAKIDAAFAMPASDDKKAKQKRFKHKRRSRNFEPPDSDSSADTGNDFRKRSCLSPKRYSADDRSIKSEAEEHLEAALSEFQQSFSSMQHNGVNTGENPPNSTGDNPSNNTGENPPKPPVRTSKPASLVEHRLRQFKDNSDPTKVSIKQRRSVTTPTTKISVGMLRPWTPPVSKAQPSSVIINKRLQKEQQQQHKEPLTLKIEEPALECSGLFEDQLSPLPSFQNDTPSKVNGVQSLPCRKMTRRSESYEPRLKAKSASSIPLAVRGLDLALEKSVSEVSGPWNKEDLKIMLTVMESELDQEREEKERLAQELNKSREEKERLLEQSKQAVSQLQKFTSLFLDSSPDALENAKRRYKESKPDSNSKIL